MSTDGERGWRVTPLAATPWLRVAHVTAAQNAPGESLHVHHDHAESFFVLAGGSRLLLADGERELQTGSWVQIPAGVAHARLAAGDARLLEFDAPSTGARPLTSVLVVPTGEGETITDRPGRRSVLLSEVDEFAVTEFVYGGGEPGTDPHVHHGHADVFVVLDGTLQIRLRDSVLDATAETLVVIPPGVVHSYANESADATRILNLHAPSSGFGEYLRGRNSSFDQHAPPDDRGADPASVVVARL